MGLSSKDQQRVLVATAIEGAIAEIIDSAVGRLRNEGCTAIECLAVVNGALGSLLFDMTNIQVGNQLGMEESQTPETINVARLDRVLRACQFTATAVAKLRYPKAVEQLLAIAQSATPQTTIDKFNEGVKGATNNG